MLKVNIDTEYQIVMNSLIILFDSGVHQGNFLYDIFSPDLGFLKISLKTDLYFLGQIN